MTGKVIPFPNRVPIDPVSALLTSAKPARQPRTRRRKPATKGAAATEVFLTSNLFEAALVYRHVVKDQAKAELLFRCAREAFERGHLRVALDPALTRAVNEVTDTTSALGQERYSKYLSLAYGS